MNYMKVPLRAVIPELPMPATIYVHIKDKYLKYIEKDEEFTAEQYNRFIAKKVHSVYVNEDELEDFVAWLKSEKETALEKDALKIGGKLHNICEANADVREMTFDVFVEDELDLDKVSALQGQADELCATVAKDPRAAVALAKLAKFSGTIVDHSVNVANLSVFLGLTLGHSHPLILQNLYLGGLFHDFGKTKLANEGTNLDLLGQKDLQHPKVGSEILRKSKKFPDQVVTIINQHHEQFSGGGFPEGIKGKDIYELSRIVCMANVFDRSCIEKKGMPEKDKVAHALKIWDYDRGKVFDPDLIGRCAKALNLAFADKM